MRTVSSPCHIADENINLGDEEAGSHSATIGGKMGSSHPLGFVDHSPFAAFGAELVYGIQANGALVHVSDVPRGLACGCSCPACGGTLIARKGDINVDHFGHHAKGSGCGVNAETNAHSWAKEVLATELRILLPSVEGRVGRERLQTHNEGMFLFAHAELEKPMESIVPDVVLTTAGGQKLLIEVLVTHPCGSEKIQKLRDRGLATLEVDMSRWRKSTDRGDIERALIENAPRRWLYNRKVEEAEEKLATNIKRREAKKEDERRRAAERLAAAKKAQELRAQEELDTALRRIQAALKRARQRQSSAGMEELQVVASDPELSLLLAPGMATMGFCVPNRQWQAALLMRRVHVSIGEDFELRDFDLDSAVRAVSDCIGHPFADEEVPAAVRRALQSTGIADKLPRQAIEDYLHHLCNHYVLQGDGGGGFEVAEDRAKSLERSQKEWQQRERRRSLVEGCLDRILNALPLDERRSFNRPLWSERRIEGLHYTLDAFIRAEEHDWQRLQSALRAIEQMVEGGEPAAVMLGLPLKGALQRAEDRKRQRLSHEAHEREYKLRDAAFRALGYAANEWLYEPPDADAPVVLARNSQAGLESALSALEVEHRRRSARAAADAHAADCRRRLRAEAERDLETSEVRFFLQNYNSVLKARPWDIATNEAGLLNAKAELKAWLARKKRSRR